MEIYIEVSLQVNNTNLNLKGLFFGVFFKVYSAMEEWFVAKNIDEGIFWYSTLNVSSVFY